MMIDDPVCGEPVDEKKAPATSLFDGERYVFCGQKCKDTFDEDPERYAIQTQQEVERT
jgi:YHS domain-containing protein